MDSKKRVRVWDKEGKYIGDFEVPEELPQVVEFFGILYDYVKQYGCYVEQKIKPYRVPSLWNPQTKTKQ
jgi:hypothetical protein